MDSHSADPASSSSAKLFAAAADRNKDAILAVLQAWLPQPTSEGAGQQQQQHVLEVAAGTGQHAPYFAARLGGGVWAWHPTDADPASLPSMRAHAAECAAVAPPAVLDVAATPPERWPAPPGGGQWDAVFAANLTHISPWGATVGLMAGAGAALRPGGGRLLLYGPFAVDGVPATPSDAAFDASLRGSDPAWGYRDIATQVIPAAASAGLAWLATVPMPANNFTLVFERRE